MSTESPPPGRRLGPYRLERLLGQGGFAWVYAAEREDGKRFAIKALKPRYASDPAFETRFRQEAAFARDLIHPGIIHIEDIGTDDGTSWFAMDLYPGSLADRQAQEPTLPEAEVIRLALGVTDALAFAHARNVIHRDIKPDNILIGSDGRTVLTDFGIARAVSGYVAATGFAMTIGTPAYISPELAQGRAVDGRSDLYSLGITLYRAITGEVPFKSRDWFELARQHVEDAPEAPHLKRPDLSPRFERIILRLLAKHPDDRYPSATALAEDLADIATKNRATRDIPVPAEYLKEPGRRSRSTGEADKKGWWKIW